MLARECQISGHIETVLSAYCVLVQNIRVNRDKADPWVRVGLLTTPTSVLRASLVTREVLVQARPSDLHVVDWAVLGASAPEQESSLPGPGNFPAVYPGLAWHFQQQETVLIGESKISSKRKSLK